MCTYRGCRDFSLTSRLTAEHEAIVNAAGRLRTAIGTDPAEATALLADLRAAYTMRAAFRGE
ncbi:hypothetical protein GCM10020358_35660 [Amorphoplanes nipponensis]|uniref:Uncharacterized protein n=1 Tax=Actinoplanes nipponensis TaxID=135950 RepID=A0A919JQH5_9ACTN|nr:hypothetical protein Ani05nite_71390 [Actinoplanes nipponensis]